MKGKAKYLSTETSRYKEDRDVVEYSLHLK